MYSARDETEATDHLESYRQQLVAATVGRSAAAITQCRLDGPVAIGHVPSWETAGIDLLSILFIILIYLF